MTEGRLAGTTDRIIESVRDESLGEVVKCALCGKPYLRHRLQKDGDRLCEECARTYDETAAVMCLGCHEVVFRLVPKRLDSGFEILPGALLHIASCPVCRPDKADSTIIEIDQWEKSNGTGKLIVTMG